MPWCANERCSGHKDSPSVWIGAGLNYRVEDGTFVKPRVVRLLRRCRWRESSKCQNLWTCFNSLINSQLTAMCKHASKEPLLHRIPLFLLIKQQTLFLLCVMWCDKQLNALRDGRQPQSSPAARRHSVKLPCGKWLIVCCKHGECWWVYMGIPQCARHEHICFDLALNLSQ